MSECALRRGISGAKRAAAAISLKLDGVCERELRLWTCGEVHVASCVAGGYTLVQCTPENGYMAPSMEGRLHGVYSERWSMRGGQERHGQAR